MSSEGLPVWFSFVLAQMASAKTGLLALRGRREKSKRPGGKLHISYSKNGDGPKKVEIQRNCLADGQAAIS